MRRTENMKFTDLNEYDYDYDYSEGETSEDMKNQSMSVMSFSSSSKFSLQQFGFRLSIDKQLSNIDQTFNGTNKPSFLPLLPHTTNMNCPCKHAAETPDDHVECILFCLARPSQYDMPNSEYVNGRLPIISWNEAPHSFDPKIVHRFYKQIYLYMRSQIRFNSLIPPTVERFQTLSNVRRDVPSGRIVFQYVGFGFPTLHDGNIYAIDQKTYEPAPVSLKKIFKGLPPPALYIFDCDNAAEALSIFQKTSNKMVEKNGANISSQIPGTSFLRQTNWKDYYCLCATDVGEELPSDPRLPRDLLSSIIATPVTSALLIHILEYYRTSFTDPDFPFSHLKTVLAYESAEEESLHTILTATIDSIACETLTPELFTTLFRKDKTTRMLFRNFVLARYLLDYYGIHPKSHPELPEMSKHLLWKHWQTTADMWITSKLTPRPRIRTNFFTNAIATLESFLKLKRQKEVSLGLLTTVCYAPFADQACSRAYSLLAEYASHGKEYVNKLMTPFLFVQSAERLCFYGTDLHSISFILLVLINANPSLIDDISPMIDVSKLTKAICNQSIPQETRALITAFLVVTGEKIRGVKQYTSSKKFIEDMFSVIKTSEPFLLSWILMLFVAGFQNTPIDIALINNSSIHLQIACGVRHESSEVRVASILALASLLQPNDSTLNGALLLYVAPAVSDASIHVRFALFIFVMKYITFENPSIVNFYKEERVKKNFDTFTDFLTDFIPFNSNEVSPTLLGFGDFENLARSINKGQDEQPFLSCVCNLSIYLLDHFTHDPFESIAIKARRAKIYINKELNLTIYNQKEETNEEISDEDSELIDPHGCSPLAFAKVLLSQISNMGLYAPSVYKVPHNAPIQLREYGVFDLKTAHLQLRAEAQLSAKPVCTCSISGMLGVAVATDDGRFIIYDDNFVNAEEYKLGNVCSCNAMRINETPIVVTVDNFGASTIINCKTKKILATFSSEMDCTTSQMHFVQTRRNIIYFCTENGFISKFNLFIGYCIGEWKIKMGSTSITSFCIHPKNENILIIGFDDGSVKSFDTSTGDVKQLVLTLDGTIVSIVDTENGFVYICSSNGRILVWDPNTSIMNTCGPKYKAFIHYFACHKKLPFFMIAPNGDFPVITHPNIVVSHKLEYEKQKNCIIAISDEYPVFCLISNDGEISSYNLIQ